MISKSHRYYSATIFKEIGFNDPTAVGLIVSGTNFLFTLFALKYIDIIGRRKIMIVSAPGMVVGLTLASISFYCEYRVRSFSVRDINATGRSHKTYRWQPC